MKFAAIQMNSSSKVDENLSRLSALLDDAKRVGATHCLLPENFAQMPVNEKQRLEAAESLGDGPVQTFLSQKAKELNTVIIAGGMAIWPSVAIKSEQQSADENERPKVFNTCLVYNNQGEMIKSYRKQHLFDVDLTKGKEAYRESDYILPGERFNANDDLPMVDSALGKIGLSICYDLRFSEYYRLLSRNGMSIMVLPAAFTKTTGLAHWQVLLRARAIENQVYVIAAGQTGVHDNNRETFGHSMIIDPWGEVIASSDVFDNQEGVVVADLSIEKLQSVRQQIPCLKHRIYD